MLAVLFSGFSCHDSSQPVSFLKAFLFLLEGRKMSPLHHEHSVVGRKFSAGIELLVEFNSQVLRIPFQFGTIARLSGALLSL